jgi:hypothetical protein
MKKSVFFVLVMIFTMGGTMAFAGKMDTRNEVDDLAVSLKMDKKASEEETINRLVKRVEEIRDMDKSEMTVVEKRELRKELREINKNVKKRGTTLVISGSTLLIIILILLLI